MTNLVHYGDIVFIDLNQNLLFSNGFFDSDVYFISNKNIHLEAFEFGLFKIYPNFSYKDLAQVDRLKNQLDLLRSLSPEADIAYEEIHKDIKGEKKALEDRSTKLNILNEKILKESIGKPIKFGQKIQLLHIQSQTFLSALKTSNDAINLGLVKKGNKDIYFKFRPMLELIREGDIVEYNTPLQIICIKTETPIIIGKELNLDNLKIKPDQFNLLTNNPEEFPAIVSRRKEPLLHKKKVCESGLKPLEGPQNVFIRKHLLCSDQEEIKRKKILVNGDYVRISNDRVYLTVYPGNSDFICFQAFGDHQNYRYNTAYTLFQLLAINQEGKTVKKHEEVQHLDSSEGLPLGNPLEHGENHKYILKHVVSGKILVSENGVLKLQEHEKTNDIDIGKVSAVTKNKSKDNLKEKYFDRNSIIQLKFHDSKDEFQGILTIDKSIKSNTIFDANTPCFFGFHNPDDYLNKLLRTERFAPKIFQDSDDQSTFLKFTKIRNEEKSKIFMVESLANQFIKFLDYLDSFLKKEDCSFSYFNKTIKNFTEICKSFRKEIYEEEYKEDEQKNIIPNKVVQNLMREFRIHDMIYRIFFYIISNDSLAEIVNILKDKQGDLTNSLSTLVNFEKTATIVEEYINKKDINYEYLLQLFRILKDILFVSFKKNPLNRTYCSQFIRVSINCILNGGAGIFGQASFKHKIQMKEIMLALCRKGLWDEDVDALVQLNNYQDAIFNNLKNQETFHSIYLGLIEHISRSRTPILDKRLRNNFIAEFLNEEGHMEHTFPALVEENNKIYVFFNRKTFPINNHKISLEDLDERIMNTEIQDTPEDDKIRIITTYLISSLKLMAALALDSSPLWNLMIVKYYRYDTMTKAIDILKHSPNHREIRICISEILNLVHQQFFSISYLKLPMKLKILNKTLVMDNTLREIEVSINNAVDTSLSASEIAYMNSQGISNIIDPLKVAITPEKDINDVSKLIGSTISITNLEGARIVLEEIAKVIETAIDIGLKFLKISRNVILDLINQATHSQKTNYFEFIVQALGVLTLVEGKIITHAASDILTNLHANDLLGIKLNEKGDDITCHKKTPSLRELEQISPKLINNKIYPHIYQSKSSQDNFYQEFEHEHEMVTHAKDWKNGKNLLSMDDLSVSKVATNSNKHQIFTTDTVIHTLLDIVLLNDQSLLTLVIEQLRRICSYESLLFYEFNKHTIIHEQTSLNKVAEIIKSTLRLNEISREVFFCADANMSISENRTKDFLDEVMNHLWKIFFTIYNPPKHFRYPDPNFNPNERFKEAFQNTKHLKNDKCFYFHLKSIFRPFQRIFTILKVHTSLLKALKWIFVMKHRSDERRYAIRLILLILSAFVDRNRENQELLSSISEFIHLYYLQLFVEETPETLLIFAKMLRGNKKLLKLSEKHLYDITVKIFVNTLSNKISNDESNGYLCAALNSYDILLKSIIPEEAFNPMIFLKEKWTQISHVEEFKSLNILNYHDDVVQLPYCYDSIYQTMEATLKALDYFATDSKKTTNIQLFVNFSTWLSFFESENYLLQYELKNMLAKCISRIYFDTPKKAKFLQKFDECRSITACLISDILFFQNLNHYQQPQNTSHFLTELPDFITSVSQNERLKAMYSTSKHVDLKIKKLEICFEKITLYDLLTEYIYDGCLDFLFYLVLNEANYFAEVINGKGQMKTLFEIVLFLLDNLIESEATNQKFPHSKIEKFLTDASVIKNYRHDKDQIALVANKVQRFKRKGYDDQTSTNFFGTESILNPLDTFKKHLRSLSECKKKLKEQNIRDLAESIARHPKAYEILQQIITHLKKDQIKMKIEEVKFLFRLLRKCIEQENHSASSKQSSDEWKDVTITDLKKITKIQNFFRELGLTNIIYIYLSSEDPKILKEALMLSVAYLYGGNLEIQKEFFNNFIEDDENQVLETLSNNLRSAWLIFKAKESERIYYLYGIMQQNFFGYLKKNPSLESIKHRKLNKLEAKIDQKYIKDPETLAIHKILILILTFLQLLCEKQYTDMQLFLKQQIWKGRLYPSSFDFLGFSRQCMNGYHKVLNKYNLTIGSKVLALITELVEGDVAENIGVFLNKSFIYDMCRIVTDYNSRYHTLPRGFGVDPFCKGFKDIKGQAIFVFKTMLENRNERNTKIITEHLDMIGFMKVFEQLMQNFLTKKRLYDKLRNLDSFIFSLSNEDFKDTLGDAINIYIIYRYIWENPHDFDNKMRELIDCMDKEVQDLLGKSIFILFKKLVSSIEILTENKSEPLIRVWFPVIAVCNYLTQDTQADFLNNVQRDNTQTKISALTFAAQEFAPQMYAEYSARNRMFGFNFKNLYNWFRLLTNLVGLTITCVNVATFYFSNATAIQDDDPSRVVAALNIIQIVLASFLVLMWLLFYRKKHQTLIWERFVEKNVKSIGPLPITVKNKIDSGNLNEMNENDCRLLMNLKGANSEEFQKMQKLCPNFRLISRSYYLLHLFFILKSKLLIWHLIYFGVTVGALFHPIAAIFEIFDIAIRSETVAQLYTAISKNLRQFGWTLFLLLVVNVIYSSIGFFFLNSDFVSDGDILCPTAFSCFMNVLNFGLRNGGGIADSIEPQPYQESVGGRFVLRVLFDLSFFLIMIILLLNLIFGIIIDSFGQLRDQKARNEEDQKNICFICGISRSNFERYSRFEDHINEEHNIWSYVYYIIYLLDRQKTSKVEMTDIEHLVLRKYRQKDFDWFPIGQSLTLEKIFKQENVNKDDQIAKLTKNFEQMQKASTENELKLNVKMEELIKSNQEIKNLLSQKHCLNIK